RHTRSKRDWSSDVCSSDLNGLKVNESLAYFVWPCWTITSSWITFFSLHRSTSWTSRVNGNSWVPRTTSINRSTPRNERLGKLFRSEERRVGRGQRTSRDTG